MVAETQRRLDQNEAEKRSLEAELETAQAKLSASRADGAPSRDEFDLTQDDWKSLAAAGRVKARYPCRFNPHWHLGSEATTALGLSHDEVSRVEAAYTNELDRLAGVIQSACARALGNPELARRLGTEVCVAVNMQSVQDDHADLQTVADVRAGNAPMPAGGALDPFATMLLAQTGASRNLEEDLVPSFGPEEAHRIAFSNTFGECSGAWGTP